MPGCHSQSTSPIDPVESPNINKRVSTGRRKSATSRNPARVVRESPSMKPQRKKQPAALAPTQEIASALSKKQRPSTPTSRQTPSHYPSQDQLSFQSTSSRDVSSNESVSPEPLSEVLMAPPPPRNRSSRSPRNGRSGEDSSSSTPGAPATPASLMKLTKTNLPTEDIPPIAMGASDFLNGDVERIMADPPPAGENDGAVKVPSPPQSISPAAGASKTPLLKPMPSSGSGTLGSGNQSPSNTQTPGGTGASKRVTKSGAGARGGKRGSVSSSPALPPKISPSIKPLLPQGKNI
jgi:hypothetical protein